MSEELQDKEVSSSLMHRSDSAETLCFCDIESEGEFTCCVCHVRTTPEVAQELAEQWLDRNISLLMVKNIVYLRCRGCLRVFHLACITRNLTVDDLRALCEEDFCCEDCLEPFDN